MISTIYITEIVPEKSGTDWIAVNTHKWGLVRLIADKTGYEIAWADTPEIKFDGRYRPMEGAVFLKEIETQKLKSCGLRLPKL